MAVTSPYLDFEKPIAQISQRAADYRAAGDEAGARHAEGAARRLLAETYARLSPWQKTQVARHPQRPHFSDMVPRRWSMISCRWPVIAPWRGSGDHRRHRHAARPEYPGDGDRP
jgi:hypothetical protein